MSLIHDRRSARHSPTARLLATCAAIAVVYGCGQTVSTSSPPSIDPRIWRLMQCVECLDNERTTVVAMQDTAVPALRYLLLHGPPTSIVARYDSSLRTPRPAIPPATGTFSPPAHVVDARVQDFIAFHRIRSGVALGLIGTDSARKTLCDAKTTQLRADVMRIVDSSLSVLSGSCP